MLHNVKSPFEGEPATVEGRDPQGRRAFGIVARFLSPDAAMAADLLALLAVPFMWFMYMEAIFDPDAPGVVAGSVVAFLLPLFLIPVQRAIGRHFMTRTIRIEMAPDTVLIVDGKDIAAFDRQLPHSFSMLAHDKAPDEEDEIEASRRGGRAGVPRRYYTRSYVVTYDYLGQRHDIVVMMGKKEASALHARLVLCDRLLDAERNRRDAALTTGPDWAPETGVIEQ